jgi:hypothetical protein
VEASDGRLVADGAVWSSAIVEVKPAGERGGSFGAVAVDRAVCQRRKHPGYQGFS